MSEPRTVWAIMLPIQGGTGEMWCVCRAETPEGAAAVIEHIMKSGDKSITLIQVKAEMRID